MVGAVNAWEILTAVSTLGAVLVALGIAVADRRRLVRLAEQAERDRHLRDLDETRRLITSVMDHNADMVLASVVNALRHHSKLLKGDEVAKFSSDWVKYQRAWGSDGGFVGEVLRRIDEREKQLRDATQSDP